MDFKYLVRLDDACPQMNSLKWGLIEEILDKYDVKPLVGIIPHNEDKDTIFQHEDPLFWDKAINWKKKDWSIALHGYNHVYSSTNTGINPVHNRSEFAGLDYSIQAEKLKKGFDILLSHNINPQFFFAPSHTYDINTLKALKSVTPIRNISDSFALKPYSYKDINFVPQQMGRFRKVKLPGYWTFCFHPNAMSEFEIDEFESFIKSNIEKFISFADVTLNNLSSKSLFDKILSFLYFAKRKINFLLKS